MNRNAAAQEAAKGGQQQDRKRDNSKRQEKDETTAVGEAQSKQRVFAVCKKNKDHRGARVYRTGPIRRNGETGEYFQRRYCICDSCGTEWFQDGPVSDPSKIPAETD